MGWTSFSGLKRRSFSTTFSPLGLSPVLWLDSQDLPTLWTDTSETTNSGNGSPVGRWKDKSGHGYDADTLIRPIRIDSFLNTYTSLLFSGSQGFTVPTITQSSSAGEIWVVCYPTDLSTSILIETSTNFTATPGAQELALSTDIYAYYHGNVGDSSCQIATTTIPHYYRGTVNFSLSSNEASIYVDGSPTSGTTRAVNSNNSNTLTSQPVFIGMRSGGSLFYRGCIGEILMFDKALTIGEAADLSTYLSAKWGI